MQEIAMIRSLVLTLKAIGKHDLRHETEHTKSEIQIPSNCCTGNRLDGVIDQHNKLENPELDIHKNATEDKIGSRV